MLKTGDGFHQRTEAGLLPSTLETSILNILSSSAPISTNYQQLWTQIMTLNENLTLLDKSSKSVVSFKCYTYYNLSQ